MTHVLFPLFLYLVGVLLLLPGGFVPRTFVAWTAFAWGALAWILSTLLALVLPLPFSPTMVLLILVVGLSASYVLSARRQRLSTSVILRELTVPAALFTVVVTVPALLRVVHVLPDSFDMLLIARDLADSDVAQATLVNLGFYGPAWSFLQLPASWFGAGFFFSLPAGIAFTLVAALRYFCYEGLSRLGWPNRDSSRQANLVTLLFVTTLWVFFQFTYFHNGSLAALYLLLGVGALWLGLVDRNEAWLWVGSLALLGLSLVRVETVVFALAILAVAIASSRFADRRWPAILLPFVAGQIVWYTWLLLVATPETRFLSTERIVALAGNVVFLYLAGLSLRLHVIQRFVVPYLYFLLLAGLGLALTAVLLLYPDQLSRTVTSTLGNFFTLGTLWWGLTWWLAVAGAVLLARAPRFVQQRFFTGVIASFVILYLILGIVSRTYSVRADSSGSRMALHILPVVILFLALRAAPYLAKETTRP